MANRGSERLERLRKSRAEKGKWPLNNDIEIQSEDDMEDLEAVDKFIKSIYIANGIDPDTITENSFSSYTAERDSLIGGSSTDVSNVARAGFNSDTENSDPSTSTISSEPKDLNTSALPEEPEQEVFLINRSQENEEILRPSTSFNDGYLVDGPVFRAQIAELEEKTVKMKASTKSTLKIAKVFLTTLEAHMSNEIKLRSVLQRIPSTIPVLLDYVDRTWSIFHEQNIRLQKGIKTHILNELQKHYDIVVKDTDIKKRDFQAASTEYYRYTAKYLSIKKEDLLKNKGHVEKGSKNIARKSKFDMVRFDYFNYLQNLHRGIKENKILFNLASEQHKNSEFFDLVTKGKVPGIDELSAIEMAVKEDSIIQTVLDEEHIRIRNPVYSSHNRHVRNMMNSVIGGQSSSANVSSLEENLATNEEEDRDLLLRSGKTMEGILYSTSKPNNSDDPALKSRGTWHKYWCVLDENQISEFRDWKTLPRLHMSPISLFNANVHQIDDVDRKFCFEVITPHMRRVYQALTDEDRKKWVACIRNSIEEISLGNQPSTSNGQSRHQLADNPEQESKIKSLFNKPSKRNISSYFKSIFSAIFPNSRATEDLHNSIQHNNETSSSTIATRPSHRPLEYFRNLLGSCIKRISTPRLAYDTNHAPAPASAPASAPQKMRITTPSLEILRRDLSNKRCAECGFDDPTNCCVNLGIIVCNVCSIIHKRINSEGVISLITDLNLYTPDIEELIISVGNDISNNIWDPLQHIAPHERPAENLSSNSIVRPRPFSTYEEKSRYIQDKYTAKAYICSAGSSPNQELMNAIDMDDIPAALRAISRGVDFNTAWYSTPDSLSASRTSQGIGLAVDQRTPPECCESYHPLHKALLYGRHAEASGSSSRNLIFPMAELLLQHGASTTVFDLHTHRSLGEIIYLDINIEKAAVEFLNGRPRATGEQPIVTF
ncbi:hypothetical protein PHYBLDRAFT_150417 [Phycomyces blakesleeanus NRRL 1555(-)]|uniref:Uncharacterized protein n=1 Tax=Phycomyces blakesleeanus (strain ATCC 8743b / DSM 1359 / FGSC 10004 / NBRC 33097 / NRRL 1555) TaxID=763407 RepID=A0A162TFQ9_PHYB8|nr:hypothetical protein PHYBLDRAFT_150417 [Phycomyces blakesleeanus NRRL 1555(-)]OAD68232.1 hypothetical protein PHYBLDRAFT_150417 [Phycomyces blakesleeanus NRRL 1555(-)]|eukprot:XP_018286272.1 hypothetical protein PHYBLDRAFT_150417 [Phycomyces blakesleeanus NRRL 1555(-)]